MTSKNFNLSRPVTTHDGQVTVLQIREPIAQDFIDLGRLPFKTSGFGQNMQIEIDFGHAALWASRLTGLDDILIGKLPRGDFLGLITAINEALVSDEEEVGNST